MGGGELLLSVDELLLHLRLLGTRGGLQLEKLRAYRLRLLIPRLDLGIALCEQIPQPLRLLHVSLLKLHALRELVQQRLLCAARLPQRLIHRTHACLVPRTLARVRRLLGSALLLLGREPSLHGGGRRPQRGRALGGQLRLELVRSPAAHLTVSRRERPALPYGARLQRAQARDKARVHLAWCL